LAAKKEAAWPTHLLHELNVDADLLMGHFLKRMAIYCEFDFAFSDGDQLKRLHTTVSISQ